MTFMPVLDALQQIRREYLALPGLSLTRGQVQRMYALDPLVCDGVLAALGDVGFLEQTADGRYVRPNGWPAAHLAERAGASPSGGAGNRRQRTPGQPRRRAA